MTIGSIPTKMYPLKMFKSVFFFYKILLYATNVLMAVLLNTGGKHYLLSNVRPNGRCYCFCRLQL